ncbi:DUF885 domain-containing protein [Sphingosinicella rhizophila]|uniref:DUF885 domain-containing protein n=1 Tax=Sphingosinicella rhizophila TaxID=3050082 RepID=A0ABU3Q5C4_9SPHN|nr:DUF885 domain-containing protein [Sphingosinicella sp. GR2756]MDT9598168.1 DUF885 domain-containing protein [Sphingosinicella sp. GR2756]
MRRTIVRISLLVALIGAAPAAAAPADDFRKLLDDHYAWLLREDPVYATQLGVRDHDHRIADISSAARDRRATEARAFLARLENIPGSALGPDNRTDRAILKRMLEEAVEANRHAQRTMLFSTYFGWHQDFIDAVTAMPFRTRADFESYLARIAQYPTLNDAALAITEEAVRGGFVRPCSVLANYERTVSGVIAEDMARSRYYEPFAGKRPADVDVLEWQSLQSRARTIIKNVINPAYAKHRAYFRVSYLPHCAKTDGISALPGGREYYAFRVRAETTTDLSPDRIHQIGLEEVRRIRADMAQVAREAGFPSREAFIQDLRTNPVHYAATPEALMAATALVTKTIDGKMPSHFGILPRLPYGIRAIPQETAEGSTTAYYMRGTQESGVAGTYYVNTSKLDQRPLWEIPALSLHEAVPGHHQQIALQQEMDIAPFRRNFTGFTAFIEGWGLYAESLGEEMGLYDTPAKRMGQLSYQMWRAARLVVDTGIHAQGWDKARAVAFMRDNTALSDANIDAEVNRYISWPAQALAYKLGELKIKELRARAERELGSRFDLRHFHDALLRNGPLPLDLLEAQMVDWITVERTKA